MQKYVVGFAFNRDMTQVVLINKERPSWQKGLLNGVGGKVEPGESYIAAMVREFQEETGVHCSSWELFHEEAFETGAHVTFFYTRLSDEQFAAVRTMTDEIVVTLYLGSLIQEHHYTVYNIPYLLMMARATQRYKPGRIPILSHVLKGFAIEMYDNTPALLITSPAGDKQLVHPSEQSKTGRTLHALASALLPQQPK